jgi:hypothetical protein
MYYLIQTYSGIRRCIHKNPEDIYIGNMNIDCGRAFPFPSNVKFCRDNDVICTGASNTTNAQVFCDYFTAKKMNII